MRSIETKAISVLAAFAVGLASTGCDLPWSKKEPAPKVSWDQLVNDPRNGISVFRMIDSERNQLCYVVTRDKVASPQSVAMPPCQPVK